MAQQIQDDNKFTEVRLPKNIVPSHYDIWIKPDFNSFKFEGKVDITFERLVDENTNELVLHVNDIKIHDGHLGDSKLMKVFYSNKSETATLQFDKNIPTQGKISLKYTGNINDLMAGFYRSSFDLDGQKVYAATTQCEATDARRIFPSWDEPAIKATFKVTTCYKSKQVLPNGKTLDYIALSNTSVTSQTEPDANGEITVEFRVTPKMSTYLFAIIIGPFEYIEKSDGVRPVRVYTTPGKKELGQFALDVACRSLRFYEEYFNVPYPLEKMDLIAIPDFACGAMENWGLVTYRESTLLVDPQNSTAARKQVVLTVIAHELAHQWFGNLVTMQWWTHLWLNEGFASFMENFCSDKLFPEYEIWPQFVAQEMCSAMNLDSMHNSHPIEVPVNHPSEVNEIFDLISYEKGACVIRMLHNYIGDDCFRAGMKNYLTKFSYANATTEDLWACLGAASGKPVAEVMHGWTSRMGYPWLSVQSKTVENNDVNLVLTQEKFSIDGENSEEEMKAIWQIPISTTNGLSPQKPNLHLMSKKTDEVIVPNAGESWIKINPSSFGFFRVAYPPEMLEKFAEGIRSLKIPPVDRFNIQTDYFALAFAGKLDTVSYLKFLKNFQQENDYNVWASIDNSLTQLGKILMHTDYKDCLEEFGICLYKDIYESLKWEPKPNEKHTETLNRSLVLNRLVSYGEPKVIEEAIRRFRLHIENTEMLPADFRMSVYKAVARYGNDNDVEELFRLYTSSDLQEEKNRLCSALAFAMQPERLNRVANFCFSEQVRDSDKMFILSPLGQTNPNFAWKLFVDKKDYIWDKFGGKSTLPRIVEYVTKNFATEEKAHEITKFFEENKFTGTERTVKQSLENIRFNVNWLTRESKAVRAFLINLRRLPM